MTASINLTMLAGDFLIPEFRPLETINEPEQINAMFSPRRRHSLEGIVHSDGVIVSPEANDWEQQCDVIITNKPDAIDEGSPYLKILDDDSGHAPAEQPVIAENTIEAPKAPEEIKQEIAQSEEFDELCIS